MRDLFAYSRFVVAAACGATLVALAGCSSVQVTERQPYEGEKLPRPDRILVYDFAATPNDLPAWSNAARVHGASRARTSAADLAAGRKLGVQVAQELLRKIDAMGLVGVRAEGQPAPEDGDIAIVGYFTSVEKGSAAERVAIGFGEGAAEAERRTAACAACVPAFFARTADVSLSRWPAYVTAWREYSECFLRRAGRGY